MGGDGGPYKRIGREGKRRPSGVCSVSIIYSLLMTVHISTWLVWLWLDIVYKAEYESAVLYVYLTAAVLRAEFLVPSLS
jgi:hypothetical protein